MAVPHTCSQSWVTIDGSRFSDDMSDEVTIEQQRKEELAAMVPPSKNSSVSANSRRTEQWVDETCRDRTNEVEEGWPNSNATDEFVAEVGCSRAPPVGEAQLGSQTDMEQDLTYVGGMGYARPRGLGTTREPTRVCAYGKHKKVRPPILHVGEPRQEASRVRSMTGSLASSQRSSVYKAALLDAQAETQRALAGLASTRAECNEQHLAIVENIKVKQTTMREGLQVSDQVRTAQNVQNARVDTLGHRMGEMNDMLMARELRVETQINDLSNQMHTVLNAIDVMRRERSLPRQPSASGGVRNGGSVRVSEPTYPSQLVKPELPSALKPSTSRPAVPAPRKDEGVAGNVVIATPDAERKPARVQMRGHHNSAESSMPSAAQSTTRDQGVDPMSTIYLDSSVEVDLSNTKATLGSQTEGATFATAPILMSGPDSLYLTADLSADHGLPSGTPCASSTRKKDEIADLSIQATLGSHDRTREGEAKVEEGEAISPEQLRFTAAISKAMSKELAPLLAGRDLAQARPNVYRGSKDGSIDGWILIMQRYLKRTQTKVSAEDQAWSIIGHLEGEARNYIINKAESERDTPRRCLNCYLAALALEEIVCQYDKPSRAAFNMRKKTGCSI